MHNIYQSDSWLSFSPVDRAQVLLVAEGVKRGAVVQGEMTTFADILGELGLDYRLATPAGLLHPVFRVAKTDTLLGRERRLLLLPEGDSRIQEISVEGWFLDYSACCVEEYARKRTPDELLAMARGSHYGTFRFGREVVSEETYPSVLDYRPRTFTPCAMRCPDTIRQLSAYKRVLLDNDPVAARALAQCNKQEVMFWREQASLQGLS